MSREIKFRAWDKSLRKMISPYCVNRDGSWFPSYSSFERDLEGDGPLMQYTGIKDKNGKEIFEGDIAYFLTIRGEREKMVQVMHTHDHNQTLPRADSEPEFLSTFGGVDKNNHMACFCWYNRPCEYMEVVGNIHQNPELLEQLQCVAA